MSNKNILSDEASPKRNVSGRINAINYEANTTTFNFGESQIHHGTPCRVDHRTK